MNNFFKVENILQLRELALREVALRVAQKVEDEVSVSNTKLRHEKFLVCISSNEKTPRRMIRKTARLASYYNTGFIVLYVQTPREASDRISLANQRHLLNHFKLSVELGGEVVQKQCNHVTDGIIEVCKERQITRCCIGVPSLRFPSALLTVWRYKKLIEFLSQSGIDLVILA